MVREIAVCRRLHCWLFGSQHAANRTRWLLDELRLWGRYLDAADDAARQQSVAGDVGSLGELRPKELIDLATEHQRATGWRPATPITDWAEEAGFSDVKDLAYALLRLRRVREQQTGRRSDQSPSLRSAPSGITGEAH